MDPNQVLRLCQDIGDTLTNLEKCIKLTRLRLASLTYMYREADRTECSERCYENLIELCSVSHAYVVLLDDLHYKLAQSSPDSMDYLICSQQLMYFTDEWYKELNPKLLEIFHITDEQNIRNEIVLDADSYDEHSTSTLNAKDSSKRRVKLALLRLRQSMNENDRLISTLAMNIDYTRATIDAIYDSLKAARVGYEKNDENISDAFEYIRESFWCKLIALIAIAAFITVVIYFVVK